VRVVFMRAASMPELAGKVKRSAVTTTAPD
jgi:hypothetical protein